MSYVVWLPSIYFDDAPCPRSPIDFGAAHRERRPRLPHTIQARYRCRLPNMHSQHRRESRTKVTI